MELTHSNYSRATGANRYGKWTRWNEDEFEVIKRLFPDRRAIEKALPHRSQKSIRHKINQLNFSPKRCEWTLTELLILKRLYPTASQAELMRALPLHSPNAIRSKANGLGLKRPIRIPIHPRRIKRNAITSPVA
jgi:hypothetical protein